MFRFRTSTALLLVFVLLTIASFPALPSQASQSWLLNADFVIYADALTPGWQDWSWETTTNGTNITPIHGGANSYAVAHTQAWGGFYLHAEPAASTVGFTHLRFWLHGGTTGGQQIAVKINGSNAHILNVSAAANTWTQIDAALAEMGNPATISEIYWQDATGGAQAIYYLDDIALVNTNGDASPFPDKTLDRQMNSSTGPAGVAIAPNGRLYVANWRENHVYSWPSAAVAKQGDAPDLIFGGDNTTHNDGTGCNFTPSPANLCGPESVTVDINNNLYIADSYHHRVLGFFNPDSAANLQEATTSELVLGQGTYNTKQTNYDSTVGDGVIEGMYFPRGMDVDSAGNLWVVDEFNHRVLKFNQPFSSDSLPDLVLGQANLDEVVGQNFSGQNAQNRFDLPLGVVVDSTGNVYVAEYQNRRVLRFDAPTKNGVDANDEFTNLNHPHDVALDNSGNLYIAETHNEQVLVYADPLSRDKTVDWQFTGLDDPMGMAFDSAGNFYVANCGNYPCGNANQVSIFDTPSKPAVTSTNTPTTTPTGMPTSTPVATPHPESASGTYLPLVQR